MVVKIKSTGCDATEKLNELADQGFEFSTLEKHFKSLASTIRSEVMGYYESNDDGFELTAKTVTCDNGKLTLTERAGYQYDLDAIQELIDSGSVTLTTILQCVTFRAKDLQTALGSSFAEVATETPTQSLSFKPSSDFKEDVLLRAECVGKLREESPEPVVAKPKEKIAKKKVEPSKPKSSTKKKKVTSKKTKSADIADSIREAKEAQNNSADDDIDSILGE